MHPVYGVLTKEEFEAARNAPYGGAAKIIQRKDPLWGTTACAAEDLKKFRVICRAFFSVTESTVFEITAKDEDAALAVATQLANDHDWQEGSPDSTKLEIEE